MHITDDDVELKLDEAELAAKSTEVRYSGEEVFDRVKEQIHRHRASVLDAEVSRLNGEPTFTVNGIRTRLKEKYLNQ